MRDEEGRKKEASKVTQTKQHSTSKAVTLPKKNELPRVGLEPDNTPHSRPAIHVHCMTLHLVLACCKSFTIIIYFVHVLMRDEKDGRK